MLFFFILYPTSQKREIIKPKVSLFTHFFFFFIRGAVLPPAGLPDQGWQDHQPRSAGAQDGGRGGGVQPQEEEGGADPRYNKLPLPDEGVQHHRHRGERVPPSPLPPGQATPLYLACLYQHWDLADLLLQRGADPNIAATETGGLGGTRQMSPLYLAAGQGQLDTVSSLIAAGATNSLGKSPLKVASNPEIIKCLNGNKR